MRLRLAAAVLVLLLAGCGAGRHSSSDTVNAPRSRVAVVPCALLIPIANSLRGCPNTPGRRRLSPNAFPYLGVSCPTANLISCDRVGVGVTLRQPAELVTVQLAGRIVTLSPPSDPGSDIWLGYLDRADLRHGPLAIPAHRGYWYGTPIVAPHVVLTVIFRDGTMASMQGPDQLRPGFG